LGKLAKVFGTSGTKEECLVAEDHELFSGASYRDINPVGNI
jgi:hypothetical protein